MMMIVMIMIMIMAWIAAASCSPSQWVRWQYCCSPQYAWYARAPDNREWYSAGEDEEDSGNDNCQSWPIYCNLIKQQNIATSYDKKCKGGVYTLHVLNMQHICFSHVSPQLYLVILVSPLEQWWCWCMRRWRCGWTGDRVVGVRATWAPELKKVLGLLAT